MTTLGDEPHDEHHYIGNYSLHIMREPDDGFDVWLNTDAADYDGICLGSGETRDEAVANAVKVLEVVTAKLQEPAPP